MLRVPSPWWARAFAGVAISLATLASHPVLASAPAGGAGAPGGKPDAAAMEQAKQHMAAGSAFYNDPSGHKCEEALVEFQKAHELSGSWKALRAMAICEQFLERDDLAIRHYDAVLVAAGKDLDAADRAQIENDLKALKSAVAKLELTSNQDGVRLVATRQPASGLPVTNRFEVPAAGVTISLHPGQYTFVASREGFEALTWQAEVTNGSSSKKAIELKPAAIATPDKPEDKPGTPAPVEMERPVPITVWIFTGLTGACAITSGTFMGLAKVANDDFSAKNGSAPQGELEDLRSDVITKNIVADVFLGATVASAATTLIFYFTRPEVPVKKDEKVSWTVIPAVGAGGAGVFVMGDF